MKDELWNKICKYDTQIQDLKEKRNQCYEEWTVAVLPSLERYVGKCYQLGTDYVKIISVPTISARMRSVPGDIVIPVPPNFASDSHYRFEFPAIFITDDLVPFLFDTVNFSKVLNNKEISLDEFNLRFKDQLEKFQGLLNGEVAPAIEKLEDPDGMDYWK